MTIRVRMSPRRQTPQLGENSSKIQKLHIPLNSSAEDLSNGLNIIKIEPVGPIRNLSNPLKLP